MASKLETLEESNRAKSGGPSPQSRPLPLYSTVQQQVLLGPSSKPESHFLAPLQDERGRKSREKTSTRSKSQATYSVSVEAPLTVVTDQEYIARKKTFDTFLRSRDIEIMIGGKGGSQNPRTIERHSSLDQVKSSHAKSQKDLKSTLRNKEGKMFTNELWSMAYYTSVINSSHLKKKSEQRSRLMLKPSQIKAQELENLCNTVQQNKQKSNGYLISLPQYYDATQTMRETFQPLDYTHTPEASPIAFPKGKSALKSILKNITPQKDAGEKLTNSHSTDINTKDLTPDLSPNYLLPDQTRSFRLQKPIKRPQNLHISFDRKFEEETASMTSDTLSPIVPQKSRRMLPGGFIATISSKFNVSKNPPYGFSNSVKNSRRERSDEVETFEASDTMRHELGQNLQSKSMQSSSENAEARQKMQHLIDQCRDLGQQNRDLEKEVLNTKAGLQALTTKKQRMRLQMQKTLELSEMLNRQTTCMKVLYSQKQGAS